MATHNIVWVLLASAKFKIKSKFLNAKFEKGLFPFSHATFKFVVTELPLCKTTRTYANETVFWQKDKYNTRLWSQLDCAVCSGIRLNTVCFFGHNQTLCSGLWLNTVGLFGHNQTVCSGVWLNTICLFGHNQTVCSGVWLNTMVTIKLCVLAYG